MIHVFEYCREYSSDICPSLYYYSGQLLSFANIARTPEEERREKKRREENMADKVAAVLAQVRVFNTLLC